MYILYIGVCSTQSLRRAVEFGTKPLARTHAAPRTHARTHAPAAFQLPQLAVTSWSMSSSSKCAAPYRQSTLRFCPCRRR